MGKKKNNKQSKSATPPPTPGAHPRSPANSIHPIILILLLGIFCYSNTLHNPFIFDDIPNIVERSGIHLRNLSFNELARLKQGLRGNRPIAMLSFALNYYFGGLDPFGYHLLNLLIHLGCAILAYLYLKTTLTLPSLQERFAAQARQIALASALLFVAHPVQTQAVTYIVQRMASLAAFFFLATCYLYSKARLARGKRRFVLFFLAFITFSLAVGSKETAITLPLFLVLYEYYFLPQLASGRHSKRNLYLALAAVLLPALLLGLYYTNFKPWKWMNDVYRKYPFTPGQRLLTQPRVVIFYLSLLALPLPSRLNLDHHFPLSRSLLNPPGTLPALLLILLLIGASVYLARRRPLLSFALIWFWGNLFLESSFLPIELVYEHRLYLPSLGIFLALSVLGAESLARLKTGNGAKQGLKILIPAVIIIPLAIMTYQRNAVWSDRESLWKDAAEKSPTLPRPHYNLANVYAQRRQYDKAMPYYFKTIRLKPDHAKAHNNLGYCYFFKKDIRRAIAESKIALKYNPKLVDAYFNLGIYYWNLGKLEAARRQLQKALRINPRYQKARRGLKELEKEISQGRES